MIGDGDESDAQTFDDSQRESKSKRVNVSE
jgi:hypothetical protein